MTQAAGPGGPRRLVWLNPILQYQGPDDLSTQPLSSYTLADPKVMQNPYPYYERLRAEDPVHFDEGIRTWLVTRHADIMAVAGNTEDYSDEMRVSASIRSPFKAEVDEYILREGFLVLDPADSFKVDGELHTRRRKLVAHAFTGPAVTAMEARDLPSPLDAQQMLPALWTRLSARLNVAAAGGLPWRLMSRMQRQ